MSAKFSITAEQLGQILGLAPASIRKLRERHRIDWLTTTAPTGRPGAPRYQIEPSAAADWFRHAGRPTRAASLLAAYPSVTKEGGR